MEQTYRDLMSQLSVVQRKITDARKALADAIKTTKDAERIANDTKADVIIVNGGFSALGKNEGERELNLYKLLVHHADYQNYDRNRYRAEQYQADCKRQLEDAQTEFDIIRQQVQLHVSFLQYSALVATKPNVADALGL